jgi:hypothetical protein
MGRFIPVLFAVLTAAAFVLSGADAAAQAKGGKKAEPAKKDAAPAKAEPAPAPKPAPEPAKPAPEKPAPAPEAKPSPPVEAPKPKRQVVTRVAVYDLQSAGEIKPRTAMIVSEAILAEIRKLEGISAVGMKEIMEMLAFEQKKQFVGCDSVSCLVELAGALGVDELITGNLGAMGDSHIITVKRMDLASAETKKSISKNLKKGDGEEFLAVVGDVNKEMFPDKKYKAGATPGVTKEMAKRLSRPPLPRWVFFTTAGVAVAAAGAGAFFGMQGQSALDDYNSLVEQAKSNVVQGADLNKKMSAVENANTNANISFIVAGTLAAAAIAEFFFTDWNPEPDRPAVTPVVDPRTGTRGVALSWRW